MMAVVVVDTVADTAEARDAELVDAAAAVGKSDEDTRDGKVV